MFPTLGTADSNGMRPMYIGEKHDDPEHIWALIRNFNIIAPVIDAFFIEHYYRGDSPVEEDYADRRVSRQSPVPPDNADRFGCKKTGDAV